ncbi:hypothetical protein EDD85DRAFT_853625 [Armillaria nabsnona]|nr:hypothetical protein EDD85DRAFT_853625 [Armillaria nabsnona]
MVYLDLDGCLHHSPHTFPHFTSLFDLGLGTFQCVYLLRVSSDCREIDHRLLWQIPALSRDYSTRTRWEVHSQPQDPGSCAYLDCAFRLVGPERCCRGFCLPVSQVLSDLTRPLDLPPDSSIVGTTSLPGSKVLRGLSLSPSPHFHMSRLEPLPRLRHRLLQALLNIVKRSIATRLTTLHSPHQFTSKKSAEISIVRIANRGLSAVLTQRFSSKRGSQAPGHGDLLRHS